MSKTKSKIAATLALAALTLPQAAQAAATTQCMTRPELHGMMAYMMPFAIDSLVQKCSNRLSASSFVVSRGPALSKDLATGQAAAWPMAKRAFMKFGGSADKDATAMMEAMPESAMRPLLESVVTQEFSGMIKPENCKDIDAVLGTLAPLPASSYVDLLTQVVIIGARGDKQMQICED